MGNGKGQFRNISKDSKKGSVLDLMGGVMGNGIGKLGLTDNELHDLRYKVCPSCYLSILFNGYLRSSSMTEQR